MIKKYNYLKIVFLCFSVLSFGQQTIMQSNQNVIDSEFLVKKSLFFENLNKNTELNIIAEKENISEFSIYIKNVSKDTLILKCQDSKLYIIQEAKNKDGDWKPIEYWSYSWCGNSDFGKAIAPEHIIRTKSKCYSGSYETEIRFKLLSDNKVYYSNVLNGTIEFSLFNNSTALKKLKEHPRYALYGERPTVEMAEKILFLEPNGWEEFNENEDKWLEEMKKEREEEK